MWLFSFPERLLSECLPLLECGFGAEGLFEFFPPGGMLSQDILVFFPDLFLRSIHGSLHLLHLLESSLASLAVSAFEKLNQVVGTSGTLMILKAFHGSLTLETEE